MTDQETYQIIRQNVIASRYDATASPEPILEFLQADGSFSDLDYTDRKWGDWHPGRHLNRVTSLCRIYATPKNPHYHDPVVKEAAIRTMSCFLDGWLNGTYRSDNWWHGDVNIPMQFRTIALLFREELPEELKAKVDKICEGNDYNRQCYYYDPDPEADGNRPGADWRLFAVTHTYLSTYCRDADQAMHLLQGCIMGMEAKLLRIPYGSDKSPGGTQLEENGIMNDYSCLAHEKCVVPHMYGVLPANFMAEIFGYWKGTDLSLPQKSINELIAWLTEGLMYLSYRGYSPIMMLGREAADAATKDYRLSGNLKTFTTIIDVLLNWNITDAQREQLLALRQRCIAPDETPDFAGTKYFWCSETLTHHRPDWNFSVHGVSTRLKRPEACCNRNVQGMYLGDGCYNLMQHGMEYGLLGPAWDWSKIPGTTANCEADDLNPESEIDTKIDTKRIFGGARGTMPFVGGLSEENVGFFTMDYDHMGVKAKKAYFCTEDRVLCMGTAIATAPDAHAFTTLDQCRLADAVWADGQILPEGDRILEDCSAVYTNGIGYVFLQNSRPVQIFNQLRSGNWMSVDPDSQIDAVKEEAIFLLGIDHGKNVTDDSYAYLLLPRTTREKTAAAVQENTLCIAENSANCQAVWDAARGLGMAVCYHPTTVTFGSQKITVEKECTLLFRDYGDYFTLQAADPLYRAVEIPVYLTGKYAADLTYTFTPGFRSANLGRALCFDSRQGFLPLSGARTDALGK